GRNRLVGHPNQDALAAQDELEHGVDAYRSVVQRVRQELIHGEVEARSDGRAEAFRRVGSQERVRGLERVAPGREDQAYEHDVARYSSRWWAARDRGDWNGRGAPARGLVTRHPE